jgi:predicted O-methyltransferase YrrM
MDLEYIQATVPTLHGWCTPEKALHIYNLVLVHQQPLCVELGVFGGRSLLPIGLAAREKNGTIVGIDAWSKDACEQGINDIENTEWWNKIDYDFFYNYTEKVMSDAGLSNITKLIRSRSADAVSYFTSKSISVLHQDSNHSEEVTVEEVNLWYDKVKPGGYWIFDDTDWPTTKKAQDVLVGKGYELIFTEKDGKYKVFIRKN